MQDPNPTQAARDYLAHNAPTGPLWLAMTDTADLINYSTIARHYFQRTPNWLTQRLRGNIVNGRPAQFTPEQLQQFTAALRDIATRLQRAAAAIEAATPPSHTTTP